MQPNPIADTCGPLRPNLRSFIRFPLDVSRPRERAGYHSLTHYAGRGILPRLNAVPSSLRQKG